MASLPACEVQVDVSRNLIRIRYHGHVSAAEMKGYVENLRGMLPQMRKGFTVLTDLSGLETMELDCMPELTKGMDEFKAKGVGTVVRIVPDPAKDIGFNILSIVHYRRGVKMLTCKTAEEAERAI
jgi:hypothetical protein